MLRLGPNGFDARGRCTVPPMTTPSKLSGTVELAARIEAADVELLDACAQAAERRGAPGVIRQRLAGGIATWTESGSPLCKVAGLGFDGIPTQAELAEVEAAFEARDTPVQVELSSLADPGVAALLAERGYRYIGCENLLARSLDPSSVAPPAGAIEVRESPLEDLDLWLDVVVTGFASPDARGVASHESFPRDALERTMRDMVTAGGFRRTIAWRDGVALGGGAIRISTGGVAQFCGAATLPQHRRQGAQAALLTARLADAASAGCTLAVVTTQPGSTSQQNVERHGFELVGVRVVLVW